MIRGSVYKQLATFALTKMPKKVKKIKGVTGDCPTVSTKTKTTSKVIQSQTSAAPQSPVIQTKDGNFSIAIQVKPGAKTNLIAGISDDVVTIQIAAPPVDGEANIAVVKYFAEILNLKKTDVSLKGGKSRQKTITIESNQLTASAILEILSREIVKK